MRTTPRDAGGFSMLELMMVTGLLLIITGAILQHMPSVEALFDQQTEAADMQQRTRAAMDALRRDIGETGSAGSLEGDGVSLTTWLPAIWPLRLGLRSPDPPGTFRSDTITLLAALPLPSVPSTTSQAVTTQSGSLRVAQGPGCPPLSSVCGLVPDTDIVVADGEGAFDLFTVTDVSAPTVGVRHNGAGWGKVYPVGSRVIPIASRTYYLRPAGAGRPPQLMKYDGGTRPDAPVVDHVVGFAVEYLGDPEPPRMRRPLSERTGPWTTYGPRPPVADASVTPVTADSSCLYAGNGSPIAAAALPSLGRWDGPLVELIPRQFEDGPWCPDALAPNRYDADLLRIRSVAVTLRVESALEALRGPAGPLFTRGGTGRHAHRYAPDMELRARITPANLVTGR